MISPHISTQGDLGTELACPDGEFAPPAPERVWAAQRVQADFH